MSDKQISIGKATLINATSKYINVFFQLFANAILSRLLTPNDYGVVAIITVFTTFFITFSDIGLATGVIQNKNLTSKEIEDIYSFTFYLSLFLGVGFILFSYPLARFYDNNDFINIGCLLSISLFFNALSMIPNALLMRRKKFGLVGVKNIICYIISYFIAIVLAFNKFGFYSLVAQSIICSILSYIWNIYFSKLHFSFNFKINSIKKILGYSSFNFGYDLLNYFVRNVDNILTGKIMGSEMLGYYNKAYTLMLYPVIYLTNVIAPVLHPILSDFQDNLEYVWAKYVKIFKILSLMGMFISIFCFFSSYEIINIMYGSNWSVAVPCAKILSLSVWFQMTSASCDCIYKSLGKSKLLFKTAMFFVPLQIVIIVGGALSKNINILSIAVLISYILKYFITTFTLCKKGFKRSVYDFYKITKAEFLVGGITMLIMSYMLLFNISNIVLSLMFKFIICFVSFFIGYYLTGQYKYLKK